MNGKTVKIIGESLPNIPWQEKPENEKGVLWRHTQNPIIGRNATLNCSRVFNSAVIPWQGGFAGVFRAEHRNMRPYLHTGFSKDGIHWDIDDNEIQWTDESGQPYQPQFSYDPRVTTIDGKNYVTWCTDCSGPVIGLGVTDDFKTFTRLENATFPYNRNGVLFPRKIKGNYVLLHRPSDNGHTSFGDIFLSESPDLTYWGKHRKVMSAGGESWQSLKIGAGAPPIETSEGWLVFYHGVLRTCSGYVYSFGAALLDLECPSKVLYRTGEYLLTPEEDYETVGVVPSVCFPCAVLCDAPTGRLALYYGAADTCVALAYCNADELIEHIKADNRLIYGDAEDYR